MMAPFKGRLRGGDYEPVRQQTDAEPESPAPGPRSQVRRRSFKAFVFALMGCMVVCVVLKLSSEDAAVLLRLAMPTPGVETQRHGSDAECCPCSTSSVPQYFQTSPELWAGPTATGKAAFLAQTVAFEPSRTYVPNDPLRTDIPVVGMAEGNQSIFKMMGSVAMISRPAAAPSVYDVI
jgi:hypothetical protein